MLTTLADLAAPLSETEFIALLRARTPLLQRGAGLGRYQALIDWQGFLDLILSGAYPARKLRMARGGIRLPSEFYRDGDAIRAPVIAPTLAAGASLIAYGVEPFVPAFAALCDAVSARTGDQVSAGLIATTGQGGAINLHYDVEDIAILQIEGSKRWLVQPDPARNPLPGMAKEPNPPETEPLIDVILEPGDFLFVPAGHRHRCENQSGPSLHAGILFQPFSAPRAVDLLAKAMLEAPLDRDPIRFDPADAAAEEARLKALLIERVEALSLAELIERHRAGG